MFVTLRITGLLFDLIDGLVGPTASNCNNSSCFGGKLFSAECKKDIFAVLSINLSINKT